MISVDDYLEILPDQARELHGLRWSPTRDAIEYGDGQTFAPLEEIFSFLEGFASRRPLMHFGHVLHFMYLLRHGRTPRHDFSPLWWAWRKAGRPARTAGVCCAALCEDVPPVSSPPTLEDLTRWLAVQSRVTEDDPFRVLPLPEEPALELEVFEAFVARAAEGYTDEDLLHWFRHGQAPVQAQGDDLATALLAHKPPTLEAVLAEVSRHDRLSGALPFVAQFVSALTIPPRRLIDRELPLGGYSDVTTHGLPEQILPGQFALDELEFLRRFAEHELLFYRREEPARRTREDLVVLVDQGVRTWGRVRLVLTAAVFALGQLARRRRLPVLLASSGNGGELIDPLQTSAERLAELLAASDLTPHPALALERVLADLARPEEGRSVSISQSERSSRDAPPGQKTGSGQRDVVLLTHPRNLAEEDVLTAARTIGARQAGSHTRLFAVAVDAHGEVGFHELHHGAPVELARFRLDFSQSVHPRREPRSVWQGDVEPVHFPFRFGLASNHERFLFAFDHAGTRLLLATHFGMLCAVSLSQSDRASRDAPGGQSHGDGGGHELLPRPMLGGKLLGEIEQVLGVSGGFVVTGSGRGREIAERSSAGLVLLAAHYDFSSRTVKVYEALVSGDLLTGGVEWRYVRSAHLLVLRAGDQFWGIHLPTGNRAVPVHPAMRWQPQRVEARPGTTIARLPPQDGGPAADFSGAGSGAATPAAPSRWRQPTLTLDGRTGTLTLDEVVPGWEPFTPLSDGRPALVDQTLHRAECQRQVLAAVFVSPTYQKHLWLFHGPEGRPICMFPVGFDRDGFALSADGQQLAVQRGHCQLEVRCTQLGQNDVRYTTPVGRFHNNAVVELGERWLCLAIDRTVHLARWGTGRLEFSLARGDMRTVLQHELAGSQLSPHGARALPGRVPTFLRYDLVRFRLAAWGNLIAVVDLYGEVFLFEHTGNLVCGFFAFRQQMAAWMPDGTCLGPEALLGQAQTPEASRRIGLALCQAWEQGEGTIT